MAGGIGASKQSSSDAAKKCPEVKKKNTSMKSENVNMSTNEARRLLLKLLS
jgi:hypothetical protein